MSRRIASLEFRRSRDCGIGSEVKAPQAAIVTESMIIF